ncbi:reverse transcriptase domain-containing protein [Tanacetum coccineum]
MDECLTLADLGASTNIMPLSVWKMLSLSEVTPTCMTLELADRSITQPIGIAEDVDVKVGKFQFPADFVVVDFDADPRVPLILGRSFLKTGRALIDVYEGELTLRVGKEAKFSVFPMDSDFLLEEVDAFLALEDDPTSPEVYDSYYDPEGDILLLESFLNDDPSLPPPTQGNYLPEIRKELKVCEAKTDKSSIDEPPKVELKDLPPHLEYAFLEGDNKLPVIIAKDLSVEEKAALIKVLKSHKRAIAWKLSDIKGINPEFYTHKILMEEDYKPAVQHQRRVNPKIHDVIKKEVEKLLDAGLIYPISDSPWNSNSYLRDILGDILGKDMYYPFTRVCKALLGFTLGYKRNNKAQRDFSGTLRKKETMTPKQQNIPNVHKSAMMISQTSRDGEESINEDASGNLYGRITDVEKEREGLRNILLHGIPKDHMRRFHGRMMQQKKIWEAIRTRFVGNANSKKLQKAHGAEVSTEDANHKFLRSLPSAWSNLAMTMRTNPEIDNLSIDDLYNNLRVFEQEIQGAPKPSSSAQNVAFVSQSKSNTNKVKSGFSGAYSSCTPSISSTKCNDVDIEEYEMGHQWQITMMYSKEGKESYSRRGNHDGKKKRDSLYQHQEAGKQEKNEMGLLTMDDGIVNWGEHTEAEESNHALMAISSSNENLWRLINSGMSSNDKLGLGFEIQSNDEVLSYEEEMNSSVFKCSKEDSIGKPLYSRFTKTNDFKGAPPPLSGDYTPQPQEEIDDALYVYGKKGPQKPEISVSDENSSEHSTCQSNDSEGSCGNTSEHSFETESESVTEPSEMSKSRLEVTNEKDVSVSKSTEVAPSCVSHIKTPRQPLKDNETHKVNRKSWNDMMKRELGDGYSFTKKKCFVCGSLNHLIKDCDYYEKKMAREAEAKRVVNTGTGVTKPVWTNANRINHSNNFVPRSVQLNTCRPKVNSVRLFFTTGRTKY